MAAWGAYDFELDKSEDFYVPQWNDSLVVAGLMAYPMAAFAKRVAMNPSAFTIGYQQDAIRFTTAVMQTYASFRPELHFTSTDPWAYHVTPSAYSTLTCINGDTTCENTRGDAGQPEGWNEDAIFLRTIAEASSAADSSLYRNSTDPYKNTTISYLTVEGPDVIAKWVQFFDDYLNTGTVRDSRCCICGNCSSFNGRPVLEYWPGDNADYYVWNKKYNTAGGDEIENLPHGQVTLAALALIYENKFTLDKLLGTAGYAERVNLHPYILERFNTGFLRLMWNASNKTFSTTVDGDTQWGEVGAGGSIMLSSIDAWAWERPYDALFNPPAYNTSKWEGNEDAYAALIRHYSPNVTHTGLSAQDIGVSSNGVMWITTTENKIAQWNNGWSTVSGAAVRIAVDPNGNPWIVNASGQIYLWRRSGPHNTFLWVQQPGLASDVGVGANGSVWVVGTDHNAYKWNGYDWTGMGGGGNVTRIAVDPSGQAWVTKSDTTIWHFTGSTWVQNTSGFALDISVRPDGTVAVIAIDHSVWWWTGAIWVMSDASSPAVAVSGGPDRLWVVNSLGQILEEM